MRVCIQASQESRQTPESCFQESILGQDNFLIAHTASEFIPSASKTNYVITYDIPKVPLKFRLAVTVSFVFWFRGLVYDGTSPHRRDDVFVDHLLFVQAEGKGPLTTSHLLETSSRFPFSLNKDKTLQHKPQQNQHHGPVSAEHHDQVAIQKELPGFNSFTPWQLCDQGQVINLSASIQNKGAATVRIS